MRQTKERVAEIQVSYRPSISYKPVITSSGVDLGNINYFLSPSTLKRFSITSQILIDYLTQIYN
jgi:hypothetical protein